jgi:tetratricopeptide (TPR) repeat protein
MLLLAASPAFSAAPEKAVGLFSSGNYREAAAQGRLAETADGYILAGKATGTMAAFVTTDKAVARVQLQTAEADFDRALALSPNNFDALLQKAVIIGYRAKLDASPGLAKQARRNFEAIVKRWPDNPLANAALAGWHGESVATLGKFLAGTALGAKEAEAMRLYDRAVAMAGTDPAVPYFYAINLLALSPDHAPKAKTLLQRSLKATPADGFESLLQKQARAILVPLDKGDVVAARATAKRLSPLGKID